MKNPLLNITTFPPFNIIEPKHIKPAITTLIKHNLALIDTILAQPTFTWHNLMQPLEQANDRLETAWSAIKHLHAVVNSKPLRKAYLACLPLVTQYATQLRLNTKLYHAISSLQNDPALNAAQKQVIANELRDFRLAGIHLPTKTQYRQLVEHLTQLCAQFANNVLDASNWSLLLDDTAIDGIPPHALALAKQTAQRNNQTGYVFTLEEPSFLAVITYAKSRKLRETIYTAYITRASDQGPNAGTWDNSTIMADILKTRLQLANLVGFNNYADYSFATKMADSPATVLKFLTDLVAKTHNAAQQELATLQAFAQQTDQVTLKPWDLAYYSEQLRQTKYALSQETLRPYFPEPQVLAGLFELTHKLFGITVQENPPPHPWHPEVKFFTVYDRKQQLRGHIYMDLYARPQKQSGAWMDIAKTRLKFKNGRIQHPIAHLICNFSGPLAATPALFTHNEVTTLFHEFGHCLQQILTTVDYASIAGVNGVLWDAVELPSQFLENFSSEPLVLQLIAKHYQTQQPLPTALINKIAAAKKFQIGMKMLRQLEFALFDLRLHLEKCQTPEHIQQLYNEIREQVSVIPTVPFNRMQHSFQHIFAGGYAAGYYSYKWAEVLAHDAFAQFLEQGLFDPQTGERFLQTFLASGGAIHPMTLFKKFRGRAPSIEALLKNYGIA